MLERDIEKAVCEYAKKKYDMLVYKFTSPNRRSVPDRLFVTKNALIFFVEFKATGKKLTKLQMREFDRLTNHGVCIAVVNDIEAGKRIIDIHAIA